MNDETKSRTSKGMYIHTCMHKGCNKWGSYGFKTKYGQLWFCHGHKVEGETKPE